MLDILADTAAPFVYVIAAFAIVFVWPTLRLKLRRGVNAIVLPSGDTADAVAGRWFKAAMAALFATTALAAFAPDPWRSIGVIALPWPEVRLIAGWAILLIALAFIAVAQAQMGASWRIGVDPNHTELKARGLFAISRNPIFLGMRAILLGLFLVLPNALTLALLLLGEALIQIQVRFEEAHLSATHGPAYAAYRAKVRRWV